jgi:hypothetical protein
VFWKCLNKQIDMGGDVVQQLSKIRSEVTPMIVGDNYGTMMGLLEDAVDDTLFMQMRRAKQSDRRLGCILDELKQERRWGRLRFGWVRGSCNPGDPLSRKDQHQLSGVGCPGVESVTHDKVGWQTWTWKGGRKSPGAQVKCDGREDGEIEGEVEAAKGAEEEEL